MTQYRVVFTAFELVNGQMTEVSGSTKWLNSLEEAESSEWMKRDNAVIVSREFQPGVMPGKR